MAEQKKVLRAIDAPFYNYWQAIFLSFFSKRFYVDVGKRWKGFGFAYLALLLGILSIPFAARFSLDFNYLIKKTMIQPIRELPLLTIQRGELYFDKPMPYEIKNKAGATLLIIDTTGTVNSLDTSKYPSLTTLITKNKILYRFSPPKFFFSKEPVKNTAQIYEQSFNKEANEIFDGKRWLEVSGIAKVLYISTAIIYPTTFFIFFAIYCVLFLVLAMMAQFVAKLFVKLHLTYKQACRMLVVSATPQIFFMITVMTLGWLFDWFGLVSIIILSTYFAFAIIALQRESHKLVVS